MFILAGLRKDCFTDKLVIVSSFGFHLLLPKHIQTQLEISRQNLSRF